MKKLWLLALPLILGAGCRRSRTSPSRAADYLQHDAICAYAGANAQQDEIICIAGGRRYSCLVSGSRVSCALTHLTPAESAP